MYSSGFSLARKVNSDCNRYREMLLEWLTRAYLAKMRLKEFGLFSTANQKTERG